MNVPRSIDSSTSTPISDAIAAPMRIVRQVDTELTSVTEPTWQLQVRRQFEDIFSMEQDWDGFGAGPIRRDVMFFAIHVLNRIMRADTPAPHVTPMSHEGLMLEWHENSIDLEIEIEKPGGLWASFEDALVPTEKEQPLSSDLSLLVEFLDRLTDRAT